MSSNTGPGPANPNPNPNPDSYNDDVECSPISINQRNPITTYNSYKLRCMISNSGLTYDQICYDLGIDLKEIRDLEKGLFNINNSPSHAKQNKLYKRVKKYIDDYNDNKINPTKPGIFE